MIGTNYTQDLKDRGLTTPGANTKIWDFNLGVGGPIKKDRMWFFGTLRDEGSHRTVPGDVRQPERRRSDQVDVRGGSEPAGSRGAVVPPDLAAAHRPGERRATSSGCSGTSRCRAKAPRSRALPTASAPAAGPEPNEIISGGASPTPTASATAAPETGAYRDVGNKVRQATWQSPVTSRLLVEAGLGHLQQQVGRRPDAGQSGGRPGAGHRTVRHAAGCANNGGIAEPGRTARPTSATTGRARSTGARRPRTCSAPRA